jgi:spermidine synthase
MIQRPLPHLALLMMGLSGIIAQILLLRELLVSFLGNELTLGIILANWLILEAAGSYGLGRSLTKDERRLESYALFQLVFSLALPVAIYLSRTFKNLLVTIPGEAVGFAPIFYSSFLILLPVSIPHGALFSCGCKLYGHYFQEDASAIGRVYVLETIGSIVGGCLITFLLIQRFNSFEIAFAIALINALVSALLLWPIPGRPRFDLRNGLWALSVLLIFVYAYLLPQSRQIHLASIQSQWRGLTVIHNENSVYGNITVTKQGEQFTFFTDGIPAITAPVPDIASMEDFVHFPMLMHAHPESVLVLSGGAGGIIHEILKHPVKRVDYVELDPLVLKLVKRFSTPLTDEELSDPRVKIHYTDGRFFVNRTTHRYDIIFIGLSSPQELQTNRLFSAEFFSIAHEKMNPRGIIALTAPGSLTYISPELRDLNSCLINTLKHVYPHVRIVPGDTNLFLASDSEELERVTPEEIIRRLGEKKIKTSLMTRGYIEYRLQERWLKWFQQSMETQGEAEGVRINSDFHPLGVFFNLSYWNALFSPYLTGIFKWFEGLNLGLALGVAVFWTFSVSTLFFRKRHLSRYAPPYAIFTSGLADMICHLAIIFTFQTLYGYLYHQIGLLITILMAGVALGGFTMTRYLDRIQNLTRLFLISELSFVGFCFILPFVLSIPSYHLERTIVYNVLYAIFLLVSFLCGTLVGLQFPMATEMYMRTRLGEKIFGQTAGLLYGADLLGGFFGGLLGGVLLLPILGLRETCFLVGILKATSLMLFLLFTRIAKVNKMKKGFEGFRV